MDPMLNNLLTIRRMLTMTAFVLAGMVVSLPRLWAEPPHTPASQPAEHDAKKPEQPVDEGPPPPREPSAADILKELSKDEYAGSRPVIRPNRPGQPIRPASPEALPHNAVAPVSPKLYADGYRLVDRPGRLTREGDYYTFSFESRGEGPAELPIRLLPNRLLEDMELASEGGTKSVVFVVSGELTAYHGANYILVQKLLTRPNLGNLK